MFGHYFLYSFFRRIAPPGIGSNVDLAPRSRRRHNVHSFLEFIMLFSQSPTSCSGLFSWRRLALFLPALIVALMISSASLMAQTQAPCTDQSCTTGWTPKTQVFPASSIPGCSGPPGCAITVKYLTRNCGSATPCEYYLTSIEFTTSCASGGFCSMASIVQAAIRAMVSNPDPGSGCDPLEGDCIDNVKVTAADCMKAVYTTDGKIDKIVPCHAEASCCIAKYRICRSGGQIVIHGGSITSPPSPTCTGSASPFPSTECTPICRFMDFGS